MFSEECACHGTCCGSCHAKETTCCLETRGGLSAGPALASMFLCSSSLAPWHSENSYLIFGFFFWHLLLSQVVKSRFLLSFLFALDLLKRETSCQNACSRTWILKLEKVLLLFPGRFVTASVRFPSSSGRSKVNKKLELWPSTLVCNSASPLAKSLSTFVWTVHMFILFTGVSRRQKEYCSW